MTAPVTRATRGSRGLGAVTRRAGWYRPHRARPDSTESAESSSWATRHELALAALCYLLAALIVTVFLWRDPASRIVAGNTGDPDQAAWWMRYAATAVAHWRLPSLITTGMNAPVGVNAMWNPSILAPGVALSMVTLLAGPQASLTVLTVVGFAGSATSLFWVLRRWSCGTWSAAFGGLAYGFSPALTQSAMGHYDLQFAVLPPLIVHALLRLLSGQRGSVKYGVWLAVLTTLQLLTSEEVLFDTALATVIILAVLAVSRARPRWTVDAAIEVTSSLLVAAGVFILIAGVPLWTQFFGPFGQHGSPFTIDFFKNDLEDFIQPSALQLIHSSTSASFAANNPGRLSEYLAYLGWPMLVVLVWIAVALWRLPQVRATAVAFAALAVFSLGGSLVVSGHVHEWIKLPWYWLEGLPVATSALADRFSIVADGCAAALLAFGVDATWRAAGGLAAGSRLARSAIAAAAMIAVVPLLPRPLPAERAEGVPAGWTQAITALRLPAGASSLVIPVPADTFTTPLRWQAMTGVPSAMAGGFFIGPVNGQAYMDGPGLSAPELYLNKLWAQAHPDTAGVQALTNGAPPSPSEVRAWITSTGYSSVIAVASADSPLGTYLAHLLGPPASENGDVIGWRLR